MNGICCHCSTGLPSSTDSWVQSWSLQIYLWKYWYYIQLLAWWSMLLWNRQLNSESKDFALFAWLISHGWKYCWLICCERKILFVGWKSTTYKPSEHGIWDTVSASIWDTCVIGFAAETVIDESGCNMTITVDHTLIKSLISHEPHTNFYYSGV